VRRRILFGVLVVAVLVGAKLLFVRPVDAQLELGYGAGAPSVRRVGLVFTDGADHVQRELDLSYPTGAPATDRRMVRLKPGDYTVGVRIDRDGAPQRTFNRPLHLEQAGAYPIDLER
jgi:hypothetical protein